MLAGASPLPNNPIHEDADRQVVLAKALPRPRAPGCTRSSPNPIILPKAFPYPRVPGCTRSSPNPRPAAKSVGCRRILAKSSPRTKMLAGTSPLSSNPIHEDACRQVTLSEALPRLMVPGSTRSLPNPRLTRGCRQTCKNDAPKQWMLISWVVLSVEGTIVAPLAR